MWFQRTTDGNCFCPLVGGVSRSHRFVRRFVRRIADSRVGKVQLKDPIQGSKERGYYARAILAAPDRGQRENTCEVVYATLETADLLRCSFRLHAELRARLR